jgi:hypothetical protein
MSKLSGTDDAGLSYQFVSMNRTAKPPGNNSSGATETRLRRGKTEAVEIFPKPIACYLFGTPFLPSLEPAVFAFYTSR